MALGGSTEAGPEAEAQASTSTQVPPPDAQALGNGANSPVAQQSLGYAVCHLSSDSVLLNCGKHAVPMWFSEAPEAMQEHGPLTQLLEAVWEHTPFLCILCSFQKWHENGACFQEQLLLGVGECWYITQNVACDFWHTS